MSLPLHQYFCDLVGERDIIPTIIFDNARLPCASAPYEAYIDSIGSVHTRSTALTMVSSLSGSSVHSAMSNQSTSSQSTASSTSSCSSGCRWQSMPTTADKSSKNSLKRPKRPSRSTEFKQRQQDDEDTRVDKSLQEVFRMAQRKISNGGTKDTIPTSLVDKRNGNEILADSVQEFRLLLS